MKSRRSRYATSPPSLSLCHSNTEEWVTENLPQRHRDAEKGRTAGEKGKKLNTENTEKDAPGSILRRLGRLGRLESRIGGSRLRMGERLGARLYRDSGRLAGCWNRQ